MNRSIHTILGHGGRLAYRLVVTANSVLAAVLFLAVLVESIDPARWMTSDFVFREKVYCLGLLISGVTAAVNRHIQRRRGNRSFLHAVPLTLAGLGFGVLMFRLMPAQEFTSH